LAGFRIYSDATLRVVGSYGLYWSSTVNGANAGVLVIEELNANVFSSYRANGRSVRCIQD